jgi:hypothetical protein
VEPTCILTRVSPLDPKILYELIHQDAHVRLSSSLSACPLLRRSSTVSSCPRLPRHRRPLPRSSPRPWAAPWTPPPTAWAHACPASRLHGPTWLRSHRRHTERTAEPRRGRGVGAGQQARVAGKDGKPLEATGVAQARGRTHGGATRVLPPQSRAHHAGGWLIFSNFVGIVWSSLGGPILHGLNLGSHEPSAPHSVTHQPPLRDEVSRVTQIAVLRLASGDLRPPSPAAVLCHGPWTVVRQQQGSSLCPTACPPPASGLSPPPASATSASGLWAPVSRLCPRRSSSGLRHQALSYSSTAPVPATARSSTPPSRTALKVCAPFSASPNSPCFTDF